MNAEKLTPDEANGVLFNQDGENAQDVKELSYITQEPDHVADVTDISDVQDADFEDVTEKAYENTFEDDNVADGSIVDENATATSTDDAETEKPTETAQKSKKPRKAKQTPDKE